MPPQNTNEKAMDSGFIDFDKVKDVLKKDGLEKEATKKEEVIKKIKVERKKINRLLLQVPGTEDFWPFVSEYWLVKNIDILKWDFKRPEYGVAETFAALLGSMGHYGVKFRILYVNTPNIYHFALPYRDNEFLFLLSVPFIKTLDLSKMEIAILLFENFVRQRMSFFEKDVSFPNLEKYIGSSLSGKKEDFASVEILLKRYDEIIFAKGFSFEQQFLVTKKVGAVLKSNLKMWGAYITLLEKIDGLIKTNLLYQNYTKIFPSPELQIKWLSPKMQGGK